MAYRGQQSLLYYYGLISGREVKCVALDGTYFDRYQCLVFDSSTDKRVRYTPGQIFLDDRPIQFPAGQNLGFLQNDGSIQFTSITEKDMSPDKSGKSEIHYLFGSVPKFKHLPFGVPHKEFVQSHLGNEVP